MKKYERIAAVLDKIWNERPDSVSKMHWSNLRQVPELYDIGDRYLNMILSQYKQDKGLIPKKGIKLTKGERVKHYLAELYKNRSKNSFRTITVQSLLKDENLSFAGKTTIAKALGQFRREHNIGRVRKEMKDCFGDAAGVMLEGDLPDECYDCKDFRRCYQITKLVTLRAMQTDIKLMVANGIQGGWLKSFRELDELMEDDEDDIGDVH